MNPVRQPISITFHSMLVLWGLLILGWSAHLVWAQSNIEDVCPAQGISLRGPSFEPGGLILTTFDGASLWVYDIDRATRYPLPDTRPCPSNCRLSPDARWLSYLDPVTYTFTQMRLNGLERTRIGIGAADVVWWSSDSWLIWTPDHRAYLQSRAGGNITEFLPVRGITSIQPGGRWGFGLRASDQGFLRILRQLDVPDDPAVILGPDVAYFNVHAWSPDGRWLAYVGRGAFDESVQIAGAELFLIQPGDAISRQMTALMRLYGATRINGYAPGELSWSPDSQFLAFWVMELLGPDVENNAGNAVLHILSIADGRLRRYCGFVTQEHTPNPPRIVWSPDGTHVAFSGNIPNDDKGYLLLAMDIDTGQLTELTDGIFPAYGIGDVTAWGYAP